MFHAVWRDLPGAVSVFRRSTCEMRATPSFTELLGIALTVQLIATNALVVYVRATPGALGSTTVDGDADFALSGVTDGQWLTADAMRFLHGSQWSVVSSQ